MGFTLTMLSAFKSLLNMWAGLAAGAVGDVGMTSGLNPLSLNLLLQLLSLRHKRVHDGPLQPMTGGPETLNLPINEPNRIVHAILLVHSNTIYQGRSN